jgi:hypothetical protein
VGVAPGCPESRRGSPAHALNDGGAVSEPTRAKGPLPEPMPITYDGLRITVAMMFGNRVGSGLSNWTTSVTGAGTFCGSGGKADISRECRYGAAALAISSRRLADAVRSRMTRSM